MAAADKAHDCGKAPTGATQDEECFLRSLPDGLREEGAVLCTRDNFAALKECDTYDELLAKAESKLPKFDLEAFRTTVLYGDHLIKFEDAADEDPEEDEEAEEEDPNVDCGDGDADEENSAEAIVVGPQLPQVEAAETAGKQEDQHGSRKGGGEEKADAGSEVTTRHEDVSEVVDTAAKRRKVDRPVSAPPAEKGKPATAAALETGSAVEDVEMQDASGTEQAVGAHQDQRRGCSEDKVKNTEPEAKFYRLCPDQFVVDTQIATAEKYLDVYEEKRSASSKFVEQKSVGLAETPGVSEFAEFSRAQTRAFAKFEEVEKLSFVGEKHGHYSEKDRHPVYKQMKAAELFVQSRGRAMRDDAVRCFRKHIELLFSSSDAAFPDLSLEVRSIGGDLLCDRKRVLPVESRGDARDRSCLHLINDIKYRRAPGDDGASAQAKLTDLTEYNDVKMFSSELQRTKTVTVDALLFHFMRQALEEKLLAVFKYLRCGDDYREGALFSTISSNATMPQDNRRITKFSNYHPIPAYGPNNVKPVRAVSEDGMLGAASTNCTPLSIEEYWDIPLGTIKTFKSYITARVSVITNRVITKHYEILDAREKDRLRDLGGSGVAHVVESLRGERVFDLRSDRKAALVKDVMQRGGGFIVSSLLTSSLLRVWLLDDAIVRSLVGYLKLDPVVLPQKGEHEDDSREQGAPSLLGVDTDRSTGEKTSVGGVAEQGAAVSRRDTSAASSSTLLGGSAGRVGGTDLLSRLKAALPKKDSALPYGCSSANPEDANKKEVNSERTTSKLEKTKDSTTNVKTIASNPVTLRRADRTLMRTGDVFELGHVRGSLGWRCVPNGVERAFLIQLT
ncbi:unnamed protein product, partial [Amoebophrya sp. A120]|eukprot:GSA120T00009404001.1